MANPAKVALGAAVVPTLPDRVGARVYSRLEEMSDFLGVAGGDYRAQLRKRRRR